MALSDLQSVVQFIFLGKGGGGWGEHHWILLHTKGRLGSFMFHSVRFLFSVNNAAWCWLCRCSGVHAYGSSQTII